MFKLTMDKSEAWFLRISLSFDSFFFSFKKVGLSALLLCESFFIGLKKSLSRSWLCENIEWLVCNVMMAKEERNQKRVKKSMYRLGPNFKEIIFGRFSIWLMKETTRRRKCIYLSFLAL